MSDQEAVDFMRSKLQHFEARYNEWKKQRSGGTEAVGYDTDDGGKAATTESKAADDDDDSPMNGTDDDRQPQQHSTQHDGASNGGNTHNNNHALHSSAMDGLPSASSAMDGVEQPHNINELLSLTAKALVKEALDRRSLDNVTVMIIAL